MCGGCSYGRFMREFFPPMCFATGGCVCVRSSMRNLWLQIALEWLLDCRHLMLPRAGLLRDAVKRNVMAA